MQKAAWVLGAGPSFQPGEGNMISKNHFMSGCATPRNILPWLLLMFCIPYLIGCNGQTTTATPPAPSEPPQPISNLIVGLDPGHGWQSDPGAVGNGLQEKDVTLIIAVLTKAVLEGHGYQVIMTRTGDDEHDKARSAEAINEQNPSIVVSIHANSAESGGTGTEACYTVGKSTDTESKALATLLTDSISNRLSLTNRGVFPENSESRCARKKTTGWNQLYIHDMNPPTALIETAFISNSKDADLLKNRSQDFAQAIADGIMAYLRAKGTTSTKPTALSSPTLAPVPRTEATDTARATDQSDPQEVVVSFMEALAAGDCTKAAVYMDPTQRETLQDRFCRSDQGWQLLTVRIDGMRQELSFVAQQDILFMGEIKTRLYFDSSTFQEDTFSLGRASMSQWNEKWYVWQLIFGGDAPSSTTTIPNQTSPANDQSDPGKVAVSYMEALVAGDCTKTAVYMDPTQRETLQTRFCTSDLRWQILSFRIDGMRQELSFTAQQDILFMGEIKTRLYFDSSTYEEGTWSLCRVSMSQWNGKWYVWQLIFQGPVW